MISSKNFKCLETYAKVCFLIGTKNEIV